VSTELHPAHWHYKGPKSMERSFVVIYPILVASFDPAALRFIVDGRSTTGGTHEHGFVVVA
jgi:hypothetical protein